jgi:hypothetical protein
LPLQHFKLGLFVLRHPPEQCVQFLGVLGEDVVNLLLALGDHAALDCACELLLASVLEPSGGTLWAHEGNVDVAVTHGPLGNLAYDVVQNWDRHEASVLPENALECGTVLLP